MIIALTGRAGAGKTAIAEHLVINHGFDAFAFAEPIYAGLVAMLGLDEADLADRQRKELPIDWLGRSPRYLLQTLGTEWGRMRVFDDLWVRVAERRLDALLAVGGGKRVVFTDLRFENEADWILRRGGFIWDVYGREAEGVRPHVSENGLPGQIPRRSIWNGGEWSATVHEVEQALATDLAQAEPGP